MSIAPNSEIGQPAGDGSRDRAERPVDAGFTLVEMLVVMMVSGVLVATLATAFSVVARVVPSSEDRIDDARSTRSLSTLLSHDTASTPPYAPEGSAGGFDISTAPSAVNNDCSGGGTNIVHMQWTEAIPTHVTYVANYRFVIEGDAARVYRFSCSSTDSGPYVLESARPVTPSLDPAKVPVAELQTDGSGRVTVLAFRLTGVSGETVLVETTSRNPSEFF
jgi:prepilin-type N-terminal cleavage/methylation domain-containing protein